MMTLRSFDSQSCSMAVDAVPTVCMESSEMESRDYLRGSSDIDNKDCRVNSSAAATSDISLDDDNLINIDFNFMKTENLFVRDNVEVPEKYTSRKQEKRDESMHISAPDSIESYDRAGPSSNMFPIFRRKTRSDVTSATSTASSTAEPRTSNSRDPIARSTQRKQMLEYSDCSRRNPKFLTDNTDDTSEVKLETRIGDHPENGDPIHRCEQCDMTFRYKRHLDRHLEGHRKNNCPHCNEKFARRKHLAVHLLRAHGERMARQSHTCDACTRSFPKRALLNRHRSKHSYESGKKVCAECGEMTDADEKEHRENRCSKRRFTCQQCSQAFSIEQTYLSHLQNHNNHKCPSCDVGFASKRKVHEHLRAAHAGKSASSGPYFCTDCRHAFAKRDDYDRHLGSTVHLGRIDRDASTSKSVFTCQVCSKSLLTRRALDQHVRRIHRGKKRFACNVHGCTFRCGRKTDLDRHRELHVEKRNVVCEHCGKTFTSISILKDHILYVHSKERQFVCEKCGKAFKRNSLLNRHKLSHEQHRPFVCAQCGTAFKRAHHLTRHLEACHRITLERKRKMLKLMKTEDGHLVPVPEKSKPTRSRNAASADTTHSQLQARSSEDSPESPECPNLTLELANLPVDSMPQVLSIVDVNTEQVLTVEVTDPGSLGNNELADQFVGEACGETLNLSYYQDVDFQNNLLNAADQAYYENTSYAEVSLENIEGTLSLMSSNSKMETIESYLTHGFPSFLNM